MITFLYGVLGYFAIGLILSIACNKWMKEENIVLPNGMTEGEATVFITFTWLPFLLISILFPKMMEGGKSE